jgi:bisphosphoglycerate-independent phosphoglycerate mutase (AlkP superfamily)
LITGDHGINADGDHGGTTSEQRDVPFYFIPPALSASKGQGRGDTGEVVSHLQIAPTILKLLETQIPRTMKYPPLLLD